MSKRRKRLRQKMELPAEQLDRKALHQKMLNSSFPEGPIEIDESKLNFVDRLGLAYSRLNCGKWDDICGPKPDGFDELPRFSVRRAFRKKKISKSDYVIPAMKAIQSVIGKTNVSRCWWLFQLGRTEEEWLQWYVPELLESGLSSRLD